MDSITDNEINNRAGKYVPPYLRREIKNDPSLLDKITGHGETRQPNPSSETTSPRYQQFPERRFDSLMSRSSYGQRDGLRRYSSERSFGSGDRFGSFGDRGDRGYGGRSFGSRYGSGLPEDVDIILQSFVAHSADSTNMWRLPKTVEEVEDLIFGPKITVGCDFSLYDDIPISTTAPPFLLDKKPDEIKSFDDIGLPDTILYNIHRMGANVPTPIQRFTIPICGVGMDVMASAPTGSGKTAAFLIPTLTLLKIAMDESGPRRMPRDRSSREPVFPKCLILSPTRELAQQIHSDALRLCWRTGLYPQCVHGGGGSLPGNKQISLLRSGCDVLVATPGRLIDLLQQGVIALDDIKYLILDEADKMLEMGFEEQVRSIVLDFKMPEKHVLVFNKDKTDTHDYTDSRGVVVPFRQTLLFSATFPKEIRRLAEDLLASVISEDDRNESCAFISIQMGSTEGTSLSSIIQTVCYISSSMPFDADREKLELLLETIYNAEFEANSSKENTIQTELHESGAPKFLVFVETKKRCRDLEDYLCGKGIECFSIHGDKEQLERDRALKSFREFNGRARGADSGEKIHACVMIATDVAQRGLHISDITHVVNFDGPHDISDYTHRVGRTGRVGHRGFAYTYLTQKNKAMFRPILEFLEKSDQEIPTWLRNACSASDFRSGRDSSFMRRNSGPRGGSFGRR